MSSVRKIGTITLLLVGLMTLFSFIGLRMGYTGLMLVGHLYLPIPIQRIIYAMLFTLNMFFTFSYSLACYDKSVWKILAGFLPGILLFNFFAGFAFSTVLPILYTLGWAIYRKDLKSSAIRTLKIWSIVAVYQLVALLTKIGSAYFGYNALPAYEQLVMSIDLLILLSIVYAIGGERYYVGVAVRKRRNWWQHVVFPEKISDPGEDLEDGLTAKEFAALTGFKRIKAMSLLLGFQVFQWAIILTMCALGHRFIEGLVITTSFIAHGFIVQRRWHSKSLVVCTLTSVALFYGASKLTIAFQYSQVFPIIVGLILIYLLYRVVILTDRRAILKAQEQLERVEKLEASVDEAWKYLSE